MHGETHSGYTSYVAGFLISTDCDEVVLIKKEKPAWMKGNLNAVGGKIEGNEPAAVAMSQEFFEETGVKIAEWHHFCELAGDGWDVKFFYAVAHPSYLHACKTMEDEQVLVYEVPTILADTKQQMCNLAWLLAMALSFARGRERAKSFTVEEVT